MRRFVAMQVILLLSAAACGTPPDAGEAIANGGQGDLLRHAEEQGMTPRRLTGGVPGGPDVLGLVEAFAISPFRGIYRAFKGDEAKPFADEVQGAAEAISEEGKDVLFRHAMNFGEGLSSPEARANFFADPTTQGIIDKYEDAWNQTPGNQYADVLDKINEYSKTDADTIRAGAADLTAKTGAGRLDYDRGPGHKLEDRRVTVSEGELDLKNRRLNAELGGGATDAPDTQEIEFDTQMNALANEYSQSGSNTFPIDFMNDPRVLELVSSDPDKTLSDVFADYIEPMKKSAGFSAEMTAAADAAMENHLNTVWANAAATWGEPITTSLDMIDVIESNPELSAALRNSQFNIFDAADSYKNSTGINIRFRDNYDAFKRSVPQLAKALRFLDDMEFSVAEAKGGLLAALEARRSGASGEKLARLNTVISAVTLLSSKPDEEGLRAIVGNLDSAQSPEAFRQALDDLNELLVISQISTAGEYVNDYDDMFDLITTWDDRRGRFYQNRLKAVADLLPPGQIVDALQNRKWISPVVLGIFEREWEDRQEEFG